ncbi:spermidine hydroxycinnamoyl transferase-like [Impatiens glandulifera]|uniref:spermidine hydroxycinnamoyl transferase-like n=1 Tax=Impatiens glandulifera TaxID=253017 RepID=UPI001FB10605|nr:spermidine hydroxycinnamoyl transferase-like [Impatiens glandulifera]
MVTVKATHVVKPVEETPSMIMYVADIDQIYPIHTPTIYFYRSPNSFSSFPIMVEILKHSLSKALVIFYPFAGRLQWTHRNRVQLNCNSLGAHLLEAETDARIDDFAPDYRPTSAVRDLIPYVDYSRPIEDLPQVLVQLTKFSCGGVSLGLVLSHFLADGQSALHFISEWVRIARGEGPEYMPFLDRTVLMVQDEEEDLLPADHFDGSDYKQPPLMIGSLMNNIEESDVLMLRLSKEQIDKLRSKANEEKKRLGDLDRGFTRFEVVAGHMWRTASKARKHIETQETALRVVVNFRNRVKPPLPKFFFGNAVLPVVVSSTSGELVSMPLSYVASKIRAATEKVTDEYVKRATVFLSNQEDLSQWRYLHVINGSNQGVFYGNPNMDITSWLTLPHNEGGTDFGWGEEDHFGPGALGFDGKSFILSDKSRSGSAVVALRLQVTHIQDFKTFFYEDFLN